ncbi:hypothetical protein M0R45_003053 [Rubus argutus]|uniref:Uncharacterized protein n=1 Tax=Rubus argutus TaxID=59490 RepID=A0AAW1YF55_RUBAR
MVKPSLRPTSKNQSESKAELAQPQAYPQAHFKDPGLGPFPTRPNSKTQEAKPSQAQAHFEVTLQLVEKKGPAEDCHPSRPSRRRSNLEQNPNRLNSLPQPHPIPHSRSIWTRSEEGNCNVHWTLNYESH